MCKGVCREERLELVRDHAAGMRPLGLARGGGGGAAQHVLQGGALLGELRE